MKKIIVFGGSGFLGSHVADELTKKGHDVTIFDKVKSKHLKSNQKMVLGDILNQKIVKKVIKGADYVYHFAAIADILEAKKNPVDTAKFNIMATMYLLDACNEFKVKRFIYSSSVYVYSEHGSFYRSSKQSCELFIENYQKEYNLNFTILRYGSLYGPRANHFNFIKKTIEQALIENRIQRKGDGNEVRDYINVLDAAIASVDVLEEEYLNKYVMITGPQTMKVKEILEMIKEILNDEIEIEYLSDLVEGHYQITPYSFKPKVALKLIPKNYHDLGQGILDLIYDVYAELIKKGEKIKYNKLDSK
ncbi:MAG: NAD-dependent epimerase [Flavobacteriaceae bacterium]|nr:NAD-dependent epimerase [Flavobacteriaceae bacterium]|tara:strand:- start:469 stop:1383 length:915 start_codon:yes stop_codon:yes gene_type:complete